MQIRINSYLPITKVEGPGTRFCIWVQGCSIHCKGCANFSMWDKNGGKVYDTKNLIKIINQYKDKIEGVTFLGGEPLEQIEAVTELSKELQKQGLTVLVFTGYDYDKIKNKKQIKELVKYIDILIDGKFIEKEADYSRPWVGSSNQNYYFFTDKYDKSIIIKYKNKLEVRINQDNQIILNGMGDFSKIKSLIK